MIRLPRTPTRPATRRRPARLSASDPPVSRRVRLRCTLARTPERRCRPAPFREIKGQLPRSMILEVAVLRVPVLGDDMDVTGALTGQGVRTAETVAQSLGDSPGRKRIPGGGGIADR